MVTSMSLFGFLFCYSTASKFTKRNLVQSVISTGLKLSLSNSTKSTPNFEKPRIVSSSYSTFSAFSQGLDIGLNADGSQHKLDNEDVNNYLYRVYLGTSKLAKDLKVRYGYVSRHWKRGDVPTPTPRYSETRLYFYLGDMISLAMQIRQAFPNQRWAIENFANGFNPGGGVLSGARAQEESLCRRSTLYPVLRRLEYPLGETPTGFHVAGVEYLAGTALLQDVSFFRGDDAACFACIPRPVTLDVIAVAAPNFPRGGDPAAARSPAARAVAARVTRNVICAAAHGGCSGVIIGMLGGGAFNGDAETIIEGTLDAVAAVPGVVKTIIFAAMDDHNNARAAAVTQHIMRARGIPRLRPRTSAAGAPGPTPPPA